MKLVASVIKSFKENVRDWKVLVMVLVFSPFFVLLMNLFYGGEPTTYNIGILNFDGGKSSIDLIEMLENIKGQDNFGLFKLTNISNEDQLKAKVKQKVIDIGIAIPDDYSNKLSDEDAKNSMNPAVVSFYGSIGNIRIL